MLKKACVAEIDAQTSGASGAVLFVGEKGSPCVCLM